MGSDSDWPTMEAAAEALAEFGVRFEVGVVSAHRTPQRMLDYAKDAAGRGIQVIIAGARNAGLLAVRILGASDPALQQQMVAFQDGLEKMVLDKDKALRDKLLG